jgi:hypothetical protein
LLCRLHSQPRPLFRNSLPKHHSSYETGRNPNVSNLRAFGSELYVLIPSQLQQKLDVRAH